MILEPKLSLLTLMVILGHLYLRRKSLPVAKGKSWNAPPSKLREVVGPSRPCARTLIEHRLFRRITRFNASSF